LPDTAPPPNLLSGFDTMIRLDFLDGISPATFRHPPAAHSADSTS
jgi:hypothetical protein